MIHLYLTQSRNNHSPFQKTIIRQNMSFATGVPAMCKFHVSSFCAVKRHQYAALFVNCVCVRAFFLLHKCLFICVPHVEVLVKN